MGIPNEKENLEEDIINLVKKVVMQLGYDNTAVEMFPNEKDRSLKVVAISSSEDLSMLIGKSGQNLKALEHVVKLMAFKKNLGPANFVIDINDYRKSRARFIVQNAIEAANRVKENKKAEALVPMSSYERRLVHVELASYPDVETESVGEEPQRRVIIRPLTL